MSIRTTLRFVTAYARTRLLERTRSRARLERQQQRWLTDLLLDVGERSPFYRECAARPFADWPVIDKQIWMDRFDDINTVGAKRGDVREIASRAETTRNFSATWNGFTVGLSSGTSGARGLFMASPAERAEWAGTLLAKLMQGSILRHERIALVLRAGSTLYESVEALRLRFAFIDQTWPSPRIVESLLHNSPTILAAPARVLRLLADQCVPLRPRCIISIAEVLDELDRRQIEGRYRLKVEQIYQATEVRASEGYLRNRRLPSRECGGDRLRETFIVESVSLAEHPYTGEIFHATIGLSKRHHSLEFFRDDRLLRSAGMELYGCRA